MLVRFMSRRNADMDRQRWKHFKGKLLKEAGDVVKFNIS